MRDFELTLDQAERICREFDVSPPDAVARLERGMINDVFSLDERYVVKVNSGHPDIPKLQKAAGVCRLVSTRDIPVPKVYGVDDSEEILPYSYLFMEYVEGSVLGAGFDELSSAQQRRWLERTGELLARIHEVAFERFGDSFGEHGFEGFSTFHDSLIARVDGICSDVAASGELSAAVVSRLREYFADNPLFSISPSASLLHGNYTFDNMLVSSGAVEAVIDWEWARAGHREEEVAVFLYKDLVGDAESEEHFRRGYERVSSLASAFEERRYAYALLYYLRVLPHVARWEHRPDKQREYRGAVKDLLGEVFS